MISSNSDSDDSMAKDKRYLHGKKSNEAEGNKSSNEEDGDEFTYDEDNIDGSN